MRTGIFGGAFNPPHIGHMVCAHEAAWRLRLDEVLLVPTGRAPHKEIEGDPGAEARVEMARLAAASEERFRVSTIEVDAEGESFTHLTLERLSGERPEDELVLIMGADQARELDSWRDPARVLELATLGVAARPGVIEAEVEEALQRLGGRGRAELFEMPAIGTSSTLVRRRVAAGEPFAHLVPAAVAGYIQERGLYR